MDPGDQPLRFTVMISHDGTGLEYDFPAEGTCDFILSDRSVAKVKTNQNSDYKSKGDQAVPKPVIFLDT